MIRILHIIGSMNRGGAETFIMNVYRNIDRTKIQFDFLLHTDKECIYNSEIEKLGGRIFSVPPRNEGILKNKSALHEFFKTHTEYKIIHHHLSSLSYIEPVKIARKYGVPIRVVHSHSTREGGSIVHNFLHIINKIFIRKEATHCFACSKAAANWILGKQNHNYTLIKNGIDIKRFIYDNKSRLEERRNLRLNNKFVIGHIGNFVYPKNHDFLIEIFKEIKEQVPESFLLLVGDGQLRNQIEEKINRLGLKDSVLLTGTRSDIPKLLSTMDVFVFPSHYEGLPVTLVEAQAADLPCVVSEQITQEVKLTEHINFLSIKESIDSWVESILKYRVYERKNNLESITTAKYDILNTASYLRNKYEEFENEYKYKR